VTDSSSPTGTAIQFTAVVYKVQTTVDYGIRVTLDLPETAIPQMAALATAKRLGVVLGISAVPMVQDASQADRADGKKARPATRSLRGS